MQFAFPHKYLRLTDLALFVAILSFPLCAQTVPQGNQTQDSSTNFNQQRQTYPSQTSLSRGIVLQQDDRNSDLDLQDCQNQTTQLNCRLPRSSQNIEAKNYQYPANPTEFQRVVRDTIGRPLTIYGSGLFENSPSTFAPVDRVPVTPDYTIGPGDEILIQAWGQVTLNGRFTVDRTGNIYVPQVGPIHVAGIPFSQQQELIKNQMNRVFRNFDLNVNMGQLRSIQVFVVGQARRPGSYTVSSLSTLVNALFATGGPTPQGSLRHIQLKRSGKILVEFDLYDLLLHGDKSKDVPLLPGDVIYIPTVGHQVAVAGSVNTPAIFELNPEDTIAEAIHLAGGLTNVAMTEQLRLERVSDHTIRSIIQIHWNNEGRATKLQDGDILEVPTISDKFANAVTLRGNVANPGRYAWFPGMRIRDLMPTRDSLITKDYWQQRAKLGETSLDYVPLPIPASEKQFQLRSQPGIVEQLNDDGTTSQFYASESQQQLDNQSGALYNNNVPKVANETQVQISARGAQQRTSNSPTRDTGITMAGRGTTGSTEVGAASTLFSPKTYVFSSGPDIDWAYAVIDRQDKKDLHTSLIPFNLGEVVLNGDESQNFELLPNDVVSIFSKADLRVPQSQQTRYVRLEGEFLSAGVYTVRPGETLRQLVTRAGGLTSEAYLYGSDFTRESTRRLQQQRLNDYANELERQASSALIRTASNSISLQDTAAAGASQQQSQLLVARLRQLQASGRIVLDLPVDSAGAGALPDLPLEDGDRFLVPRIPSTVGVDGAVYNANAFLYSPGQRVGKYLKLAGGTNRDADKKREFIVRADGSVVSRQYSSALRGNDFDSVRMNPGDTVIVPQNINKGSTLRTIVNIATIVGQFGLAAAAINLVK